MLHVNAFIVVGRGETQMTPIVRYTYSGDTYSSRVLGICHTTQIADQLKSIGCEKFVCFSWSTYTIKIFRKCCKNPLPTGASSREDLKFTHSLEHYMHIRMYRIRLKVLNRGFLTLP